MEDKALNRLLKKLSAVRATLNQDERDLLDGIIASARFGVERVEEEVTPHALELKNVDKAQLKAAEVVAHKLENKAMERAEQKFTEVKLHALETKATHKVVNKFEEVVAHGHEMKNVSQFELGPDDRIFRLELDKEAATYRVV